MAIASAAYNNYWYVYCIFTCIGCTSGIDIVFLLDSSGSIGSSNFVTMKNFVNNIVSNFDIGDNNTRIGIIEFSTTASIILPLGSINNTNQLNNFITSNISYIGRLTRTDLALNLLPTAFNTSRTSQGIPRVAIVLTDGRSSQPHLTIIAAQTIHNTGITVYALGIGSGVDINELNTIATSSNNVFLISNFSASQFTAILLPLRVTACTSKF